MPDNVNIGKNIKQLTCKNCDTEFEGNYCPECGQASKNLNRPFHFVIYDFAGTIFSFDTRFFRSLKYLLIAPGKIAHDFVVGKRARYMAPFQMYVFVSFVFFFTLSIYTKSSLKPVYEQQLQFEHEYDSISQETTYVGDTIGNIKINTFDDFSSDKLSLAKKRIDKKLRTDSTIDKKEALVLRRLSKVFSDPNLFFATAFKFFSWGLFILMPVFALLLLLFFNKKGYFYTAHLTMSLNLHTFLFLIFIVGLLIRIIFHNLPGIVALILFIMFSVYEFIGIKRMYNKKNSHTFFLTGLMNFIYLKSEKPPP